MKHLHLALISSILMLAASACTPHATWHHYTGSVWNTLYNIDYLSDKDLDDSIQAAMRQVELSVSAFNPNSTVTQVNRSAEPMTVDSIFAKIFLASQDICRRSGGLFDPTVAPLVNLWGFGFEGSSDSIPDTDAITEALKSVGINDCHLIGDSIYKKSPDTQFNFSAIAKGYGCDCVADMLLRNGCADYKVEIGGEIALNGHNTHNSDWRIMIDAPVVCDTIHHESLGIIALSHGGIATSGSYRNYHNTAKGRRSHTINPITGYPMEEGNDPYRQVSVTVIAPTAMDADGLATACMAMQADSAMQMIETISGAEALFVKPSTDNQWIIIKSSGFPDTNQ